MSRYHGRHSVHPAKGRVHSSGGLRSALRRPAVSVSLALAAVATGAAGVSTVSAHETTDVSPTAFVLSAAAVTQGQQDARATAADAARLNTEQANLNEQKAVVVAKADAEAKAKAEAEAKARQDAEDKAARDAEREALIANAQSDPAPVARVLMADFGFGDDQWGCLNNLVIGESTWNYQATNPTSGAYGLFQSLPANKMSSVADDWASNPVTQIRWGLGYIQRTYGTPCGAWNAWLSRSPHWY